ncbi:MAG TPA: Ig-like domain repeat protein [Xanthobacteraceae bacterium]|nr:Ig-like domain repeat protein [Xanthobacteraceae bacterium]
MTTAGGTSAISNVNPNTGPTSGGTSVTITGTNFSGATAVSFGGNAAASFTVNSATQITATSPAGMGTVDVTVTNENGTSATSSGDRFTYGPVGTTTAISSSQNPSSFGQPVQFTMKVTGLSPTGSVSLFDGGTQIGTGTLAAGTASFTVSSLAVGSHSLTARYSGDPSNAASTSAALIQTVNVRPIRRPLRCQLPASSRQRHGRRDRVPRTAAGPPLKALELLTSYMCTAVEIRRIGSPCANSAGTTLRRAGWRHKLGNTGTDRSELPESINAGWKHEYPRNRASDYRAREDFHAYRHPRLPSQSRADQGEAEGLAHCRRRCPRQ